MMRLSAVRKVLETKKKEVVDLFLLSKCFDGFDCSVIIGFTVDVV